MWGWVKYAHLLTTLSLLKRKSHCSIHNQEGYTPEFSGHRGHFGVGKPPPTTVPPMQHAGPLSYIERNSPCHRTVRQGGGAKEAAVSGGGVEGEHGEGL